MATFLVTGATGRQGGSTTRQLLSKGVKVHALVRNPSSDAARKIQSEGAILFEGDSGDASAISRALEGVTGVFFNPPYPGPELIGSCETFIKTCSAKDNGVSTFVLSSAAGAEQHAERIKQEPEYLFHQYYAMKSAVESIAKDAGFQDLIILRPPFLLHNYTPPVSSILFPELATEAKLITALKPATKIPHLQAEDVGLFAAAALLRPEKFRGKEFNLAAENLTVSETAKIMSGVRGVEVEAPIAKFEGNKAIDVNSPIAGYQQWANEVDASVDVERLKRDFGIEPKTLLQFLTEQQQSEKQ